MNNRAKAITIFLITLSVLFLCVVLIITFLLREETSRRIAVEKSLSEMTAAKIDLERQLGDTKKQLVLLQERMRESDLKIKSLISDLDLAKSQQEISNQENTDLKEALTKEQKDRADLLQKINQAGSESSALKAKIDNLEKEKAEAEKKAQEAAQAAKEEVPLGTIVVSPGSPPASAIPARILTINKEYQFAVTNLGSQDSAVVDQILTVTRDTRVIGELKIQRVQGNLSVADPIPPLRIETLREGDRVSIKQ